MNSTLTLLIDCGNTYLKWSLLDGDQLTEQQSVKHKGLSVLEVFKNLLEEQARYCNEVVLVSVLGDVFLAGAKKMSEEAGLRFLEAHSQNYLGQITNGYQQPRKLGNDRMLAMIGAYQLVNKQQACIVVDSGTATTIDAIDAKGQHLGGVIFPGLEASLNSLSDNTELLPKLDLSTQQQEESIVKENGLATDTPQAIASGCVLSLASAIDGICNKMEQQLKTSSESNIEVKLFMCGGATNTLLPYLENNYDVYNNLILLGLKKVKETE